MSDEPKKQYTVKIKSLSSMTIHAHEMKVTPEGVSFIDYNGKDKILLHCPHENLEYSCLKGSCTDRVGKEI